MDHLGAPFAFGFGLLGDGAHHGFVDVDVLDFDVGDLDAPGVGLRVEQLLDVLVQAFALGQHVVEFVLAEHRAQRGLRQLAGGDQKFFHLQDRLGRIDDAEIQHRVDLDRDVVARDHVLARHVEHHGAQVDPHHLLDAGNDEDQPRPLHLPEAAEHEHHAALVFAQDAQAGDRQCDDKEHDGQAAEFKHGHSPFEVLLRVSGCPGHAPAPGCRA